MTANAEHAVVRSGGDGLVDARRDAIFARRADELAARASVETPDDSVEVLVFGLGAENYAFLRTQVREVRPSSGIARLPGTPAFIAGLVNVRGRIVAVLDLRSLLGAQSGQSDQLAAPSLVVLPHRRGDVAILSTDRPRVHTLPAGELRELPGSASATVDPTCVRGVFPGPVILLDAERLLEDPRLVIEEDGPSRA